MKKRGVSPVIATVLLISIVVVLALIIFLWFKGMSGEVITKFGEENIGLACQNKVDFQVEIKTDKSILIKNTGDAYILSMKMEKHTGGDYETFSLTLGDSGKGLDVGQIYTITSTKAGIKDSDKIVLLPVLVGLNEAGQQVSYTCSNKKKEIALN